MIAVTGPKAASLSPRNRVLATQLATAAFQDTAAQAIFDALVQFRTVVDGKP